MRMLSSGRSRVAVLTDEPADVAVPTVAELNAGIYASPFIPKSVWRWSAGDPTTVDDSDIEKAFTVETPVNDTYDLNFGIYRGINAGGTAFDSTEDALFQAAQVRGTTLYIYVRKTWKLSTTAWAAADEIYLGGAVTTGTPKALDEGYIKYEVPLYPQDMYNFTTVGA